MTLKIAINGFGRIGRLVFRLAAQEKEIEVVAINDIVPSDQLAYLVKYDSVHRTFPKQISSEKDTLLVDGKATKVFSEKDPEKLPWKDLEIDYVVEATGLFCSKSEAEKHLRAGAKRVVISAPAKGEGVATYVIGVNHKDFNPKKDFIVSNASCTTNCLAPITKVLLDHFGIEEGLLTTVHAVTASQPTVDSPVKKDWRAGRSGMINIIPSSTGAAKAVALCLPQVEGKLTGMAFRVPVPDVSVVDLTVKLSRPTSYDAIAAAMKRAAETEMAGILGYCDEPVVSSDFIGSTLSSIFDRGAGIALTETFYKIVAWYDNEMGYSARIVDLLLYMAKKEQ